MEYRITASSVHDPAQLARVIMDWYHRGSRQATTSSSFSPPTSPRLTTTAQQGSVRPKMAQSPILGPATRHPILGKGGIDRQPTASAAIQARISASAKSAVPIPSQRVFSLATGEIEIGSGTKIRKVSSMGDLNHDYFFWQENTFLLVDLFSGQHRWVNLKAGWDGSRQSKPAPANLGDFNMNQVTTKSVANMTTIERIAEAMKRAAYKAPDYFKQVILDMISPENLAIIMIFAAAQATPFGWVADAAAIISAVWAFRGRLEEIHVLGKAIADFIDLSLHAQTDAELDRAADDFVIIVTSGYDLLKLIITKRGGKLRQGEKRQVVTTRTNSGGSAPPPKAKAPDGATTPKAKKVDPVRAQPTRTDPPGTYRGSDGRLRDSKTGRFVKDPDKVSEKKSKSDYPRNMAERRKALLRDANDPNSDLTPEAREFIKKNNGNKVPEGYEVSHEEPLYTRTTHEGKAELDTADNMKTQPKTTHRQRHMICGDQYHDYGAATKPKNTKP